MVYHYSDGVMEMPIVPTTDLLHPILVGLSFVLLDHIVEVRG